MIRNILAQAARPSRLRVMIGKLGSRYWDIKGTLSGRENLRWLRENASDWRSSIDDLDDGLVEEALEYTRALEEQGRNIRAGLTVSLGGGACVPLLYYLTRATKPEVIVETGVAAGFSAAAFLRALKANGRGRLYSSDFPYFRLSQPEKYIGIVVEPQLRTNWNLFLEGDRNNLPKILNLVRYIDIFHYDSDKSYRGRRNVMRLISRSVRERGVIVMDDIGDNSFFYDYVHANPSKRWQIVSYEGKYIGLFSALI
jgi:predicted O-methyltransferase YrrM